MRHGAVTKPDVTVTLDTKPIVVPEPTVMSNADIDARKQRHLEKLKATEIRRGARKAAMWANSAERKKIVATGKAAKKGSQSLEPYELREATRAYRKNNRQANQVDTKAASNETREERREERRARRQSRKENRRSNPGDKAAAEELIEEQAEIAKFEEVATLGKFSPINNY